jgi:glucose-6-phosphate-specific signal transduction histidine kinase
MSRYCPPMPHYMRDSGITDCDYLQLSPYDLTTVAILKQSPVSDTLALVLHSVIITFVIFGVVRLLPFGYLMVVYLINTSWMGLSL